MEVNAELLGGAAVTVFLALLFFGVVVLWDVALALRSVGDKIDKLEDNIDDDLTDIGHSLDNISNGRGGGGGTQLHLSGGTISSGPNPGQGQAQGQPAQSAQRPGTRAAGGGPQPSEPRQTARRPRGGSAGAGGVEAATATDPDAGIDPTRADTAADGPRATGGVDEGTAASRAADGAGVAGGVEPATDGTEPGADSTSVAEADEPTTDPDETTDGPDTTDGDAVAADDLTDEPDADAARETETNIDALTDETANERSHPRAARNRGRFVAPSDRTAWYAIELERDAIADTGPVIAGELTDGSETDGDDAVIAAGPVESAATDETTASAVDADGFEDSDSSETTDDSVVAAPPAETVDAEPIDREPAAPAADDTDDGEGEREADRADEDETDGEVEAETDAESVATDIDDSTVSTPSAFSFEETEATDSLSDEAAEAATDDGGDDSAAETDAEDDASARPTTGTGLEPVDESDAGSDDEPAVDAADPLAGDATAFEFDDEDLEDVTVEEAVETINEDAPAPELSSHRFDVSAEVYGSDGVGNGDGDGADSDGLARDDGGENTVLTYEFETDTVEISGSTKRLLQYQLRSFADRDATPEADVTIGRDRIVIEIPDSDGDAVQRWSEAAVGIIDRTLYLSDNSSDDS
ncbi:AAA family ATPase [Haloterrigena salinisoli]|uniref:AAA family ATPase n=1 Tax=Haloterrigena salinisoli TaxID=3132747 RepID=UPI0030D46941